MIKVIDEDMGSIDIGEISEVDAVLVRYLLSNKSRETDNPTIKEQAGRLMTGFKSSTDLELAWDDVFLISLLLLNESVATNNPKVAEQAGRLLSKFEVAASNIIVSPG